MAWTVAATLARSFESGGGNKISVIEIACTADADASGDQTLSTLLTTQYGAVKAGQIMQAIEGGLPYQIIYLPDGTATPTAAPTITLDDSNGINIYSNEFTADANAVALIDDAGAIYVTDLIFASTSPANTKAFVAQIWIVK